MNMEIKIDTTGIKDIERDGGLTLEELAYQGSAEHTANCINAECGKNKERGE